MSIATRFPSRLALAFLLIVFAGALRFYKLGDWPFAGDERATLREEQSLFGEANTPQNSQVYRLPRLIPLSHAIHHINHTVFGRDEFGSRVTMAMLGALSVGLVFLMLDRLKGRPTAMATGLLVVLWPEHVFQSQQARFYIVAAFFTYLCVLLGAFAASRRSTLLSIAVSCSIIAAVLCHTVMGALVVIVFAGILVGAYAEGQPMPRNVIAVFVGTVVLLGVFFGVYLKPLLTGWNASGAWGYDVSHSVLASVNMMGWPVALLGALGFLILLYERGAQNWYWITCALGWLGATVVFPLLVTYHPAYIFPLGIVVLVLAGCAIGTIYEGLRSRSVWLGVAWVGVACMGTLPSLASHYKDGSRIDMRTAARYVEKNWQAGDRVAGFSIGLLKHYAEGCEPAIPLSETNAVARLEELADGHGRVWVVLRSNRSGLSEDLFRWVGTHCSHERKVRRTRFDYAEYAVDIFLYTPRQFEPSPAATNR